MHKRLDWDVILYFVQVYHLLFVSSDIMPIYICRLIENYIGTLSLMADDIGDICKKSKPPVFIHYKFG